MGAAGSLSHEQEVTYRDQIADGDRAIAKEGRADDRKRATLIKADYESQRAKQIPEGQRDTAAKRLRDIDKHLSENLLPDEVMRTCPDGAIAANVKFEKVNGPVIQERKRLIRNLEPDNDDPELVSYERLRKRTSATMGTASGWVDQKIISFPDEAFKEGYDQVDFSAKGPITEPENSLNQDQELAAALMKIARLEKAAGKE